MRQRLDEKPRKQLRRPVIYLEIISINTTTINPLLTVLPLRLIREDIETSYKETLQVVHEEIQKGTPDKKSIFAHPRYVSPMLDFILDDFTRAREIIFGDQSIGGMVVCDSSEQARELHKQLEERRKQGLHRLLHRAGALLGARAIAGLAANQESAP